jgi:hypothetical protein
MHRLLNPLLPVPNPTFAHFAKNSPSNRLGGGAIAVFVSKGV